MWELTIIYKMPNGSRVVHFKEFIGSIQGYGAANYYMNEQMISIGLQNIVQVQLRPVNVGGF